MKTFEVVYYHMKMQMSPVKIRTEICISSVKSYNPQEDELLVFLQSAGAVLPKECT